MGAIVRDKVYIYDGFGADPDCTQCLHASVVQECHLSSQHLIHVDASQLCAYAWEKEARALMIGGGNAVQMSQSCGIVGAQKIQNYVLNKGGAYLGLCAGAFFSTAHWSPFPFFHGDIELVAYHGRTARVVEVKSLFNDRTFYAYWNSGPSFSNVNPMSDQIIALYDDIPGKPIAALASLKEGGGCAVLSGIHPEISPEMGLSSQEIAELAGAEKITQSLEQRKSLLQTFFRYLDLPVIEK